MKILAVDMGTGTQDVLLFDTSSEPENALKMVLPSPTRLLAAEVRTATRLGEDVLLTGVTMGGGPSTWAVHEHLAAGRRVYATPDAARTFNDDLDEVGEMGVQVVSEDEAAGITGVRRLEMRDFDYRALRHAFAHFGMDLDAVEVLALAVFDHGAAPPGVSDRLFRFKYLAERIGIGRGLAAFAFARDEIPPSMTRLQAVAATAPAGRALMVMDTAPAAVLGATEDPVVREQRGSVVVANVGNMHTLAFHLCGGRIAGLFEHHTGLLNREELERLLVELTTGTLDHQALFSHHGHGALLLDRDAACCELSFLAVTGPRRGMLAGSELRPYLAVPYGDMMMAGCWGMVRACATVLPWTAEEIEGALRGA
jgi:uncharacterized protein (DUF1786 family)